MYTARQLFDAVRYEKELIKIPDHSPYKDVNAALINNANRGWLCFNASKITRIDRNLKDYYRALGFTVDKTTIYWIYR